MKAEIDRWLTLQAEKAKYHPPETAGRDGSAIVDAGLPGTNSRGLVDRLTRSLSRRVGLCVFGVLIALTLAAGISSTYALTMVCFGVTSVLLIPMYPLLPESTYTRAAVGLFLIAGMAYCATATTLPDVVSSVVNMRTLRPALAYPLAAGLRFIPIPIWCVVFWVSIGFRNDGAVTQTPRLRKAYVFIGAVLLFTTAIADVSASGAHRIWQAGLPIRWTLLAGETFVFGVNVALFLLGHQLFDSTRTENQRRLLSWYATGYLLIALTAAIVGRHWNEIDKSYLDARRPHAYRVQNASAADELRIWLQNHNEETGPDFLRLSNDPEFLHALGTQEFYKEDFDEALQLAPRAVIFGYKSPFNSQDKQPRFVRIRFPADLAAALRFEVAGAGTPSSSSGREQ